MEHLRFGACGHLDLEVCLGILCLTLGVVGRRDVKGSLRSPSAEQGLVLEPPKKVEAFEEARISVRA